MQRKTCKELDIKIIDMAVMMSGCMESDDTKAIEDTSSGQIAPEEPTSTPSVTPTPNKPKSGILSLPLTATYDSVGGDWWVILYEDGTATSKSTPFTGIWEKGITR